MSDRALRQHLVSLLREGQAHIPFPEVVKDFPTEKAGIRPNGSPHSAWELLEHLRIAQEDIVRFSGVLEDTLPTAGEQPKKYVPLKWPDDYWPSSPLPRNEAEWHAAVAAVQQDLSAFIDALQDPRRDLFEPFPWGDGQTLLREALLIADHNAWHVGQLMLVRRMLE